MSWRHFSGIFIEDDPELDAILELDLSSITITPSNICPTISEYCFNENHKFDPFAPITSFSEKKTEVPTNDVPDVTLPPVDLPLNEPPRKKRSRWESIDPTIDINKPIAPPPGTRRSRWATADTVVNTTVDLHNIHALKNMPVGITQQQQDEFIRLVKEIDILQRKIDQPEMFMHLVRDRSPSPEATYDSMGMRTNTREQRFKEKHIKLRNEAIDQAQLINPNYVVPGYRKEKPSTIVYIPVDEYPDYNFSGLIIGPRGNTHRRLETETGCKISVRGKSTSNDNKTKNLPYINEPAHVFIQGDTIQQVEKAAEEIRKLLVPVSETENEHKHRQLRELAELNGYNYNSLHDKMRQAKINSQYTGALVVCQFCGSNNHASADCKNKENTFDAEFNEYQQQLIGMTSHEYNTITFTSNPTSNQFPTHGMGFNMTYPTSVPPPPPPPPSSTPTFTSSYHDPTATHSQFIPPPPPPPPSTETPSAYPSAYYATPITSGGPVMAPETHPATYPQYSYPPYAHSHYHQTYSYSQHYQPSYGYPQYGYESHFETDPTNTSDDVFIPPPPPPPPSIAQPPPPA